jgi:hypothetical protein
MGSFFCAETVTVTGPKKMTRKINVFIAGHFGYLADDNFISAVAT